MAHATCTVERITLQTAGTMNLATGARRVVGRAWVRQPCGTPLFDAARRAAGVCRSCANGWTSPHNVPASDPSARCAGCDECRGAVAEGPEPDAPIRDVPARDGGTCETCGAPCVYSDAEPLLCARCAADAAPDAPARDGGAVPVTWNADDWEALGITLRSIAEGPDGAPRAPDRIEAEALTALARRIGAGLHAYDPSQYLEHDGRTHHPSPDGPDVVGDALRCAADYLDSIGYPGTDGGGVRDALADALRIHEGRRNARPVEPAADAARAGAWADCARTLGDEVRQLAGLVLDMGETVRGLDEAGDHVEHWTNPATGDAPRYCAELNRILGPAEADRLARLIGRNTEGGA